MKSYSVRQYFTIAFLLSFAISITIHFPGLMENIFEEPGSDRHAMIPGFAHLAVHMVITCVVALLMFTLNFFLLKPLEKHGRLKALNIIAAIVLTVISVHFLNEMFFSVFNRFESISSPRGRGRRDEFDLLNFFVSGVVVGCVLIIRLIFQKQNITLENETLKREALQSQYESLKNQLSPHFLFNSLTALKTVIDENPASAQEYVSSLSKALRYTLKSNEKQMVTLKEELEFMDSYLFLIKIRFGDNLTTITDISQDLYEYQLPPLTLQTLVENAIKHNEISRRNPLGIYIQGTTVETVIVMNDIRPKITNEEGTGIGLSNMSKQFRLLIQKDIIIRKENNKFLVEVPLTRPSHESTHN
jgi:hypothetical protein